MNQRPRTFAKKGVTFLLLLFTAPLSGGDNVPENDEAELNASNLQMCSTRGWFCDAERKELHYCNERGVSYGSVSCKCKEKPPGTPDCCEGYCPEDQPEPRWCGDTGWGCVHNTVEFCGSVGLARVVLGEW